MLMEVMVALCVALMLVVVLTRGFGMAWSRARRPAETTWALTLAREVAANIRNGNDPDSGDIGDFHYDTSVEPLTIEPLDSTLPPAPASLGGNADPNQQKPMPPGKLQLVTVTVTGPSGHPYSYESITLNLLKDEK
jgi:hypothetical protein